MEEIAWLTNKTNEELKDLYKAMIRLGYPSIASSVADEMDKRRHKDTPSPTQSKPSDLVGGS